MITDFLAGLTASAFATWLVAAGIIVVVFFSLILIVIIRRMTGLGAIEYRHDNFLRKNPDMEKAFRAWEKDIRRKNRIS